MFRIMNTLISVNWLSKHLDDPNLIILDVSPQSNISGLKTSFEGVKIKNARRVNLKQDFSDHSSSFPNTIQEPDAFEKSARALGISNQNTLIIYDNLGIYTAPRLWWLFKTMGHKNVAVLDGGLPEWCIQHQAIEDINIQPTYSIGNFTANYQSDVVTLMPKMLHHHIENSIAVVDARSSGRFTGEAPEPREGLSSGHIPNSYNIPFKDVLNGHSYKSKEDLKNVFSKIPQDVTSYIFSCGSGLTACIVALALHQIKDIPYSVYDGSWTEWAQCQPNYIEKSYI